MGLGPNKYKLLKRKKKKELSQALITTYHLNKLLKNL